MQRKKIISAIVFAICLGTAIADSPLKDANLSKHLAGPEVTADDFAGKIVFFEYWGFS